MAAKDWAPAWSTPSWTPATASRPASRSTTDTVAAWEADPQVKDRFHFTVADMSVPEDADRYVKEAAERWGRIDVLVNNAGVAREGVVGLFANEAIDQVVDLNIKGSVYVTRAASRVMLTRRSGPIVNISSVVGLSGYRGLSVYGATKAALDGFSRAWPANLAHGASPSTAWLRATCAPR